MDGICPCIYVGSSGDRLSRLSVFKWAWAVAQYFNGVHLVVGFIFSALVAHHEPISTQIVRYKKGRVEREGRMGLKLGLYLLPTSLGSDLGPTLQCIHKFSRFIIVLSVGTNCGRLELVDWTVSCYLTEGKNSL